MSSDDQFDTARIEQGLGRLAARGGVILILGQGIQLVVSIATTIVLARLLVPEDFGLVAMLAPVVGFLAFVRDSGLQMATVQRRTISHAQVSTLFWLNLGLGLVLMILLAFLSPVVARFFARDELVWIGMAYAVNMLIGSASIQHAALLTRQMAFGKLTAAGITSQLIGFAVAVGVARNELAYWALVAMALATTVSQVIIVWYLSGWVPGRPQRGTGVRKMLAFGSGLTVSNLFNEVTRYVDSLLIGRTLGAEQLGYYDRGKQLFSMPLLQLVAPLANVSIPALSRIFDSGTRYAQTYLRLQEKLLIVTALFSAFLVVFGDLVTILLLGPRWTPTGPVLQAFAVGGLVVPVSSSVSWLLVTQGRSRDLAFWSPLSLVSRCVAIVCGYRWGILGIAISIASFQYLTFLLFCAWVGRRGPVTTVMVLKNMVPATLAGVVGCALALAAKLACGDASRLTTLGLGSVILSVAFFATLWLIPSGKSALIDAWTVAKTATRKISSSE